MRAVITIDMDNAAFEEVNNGSELAEVLRRMAETVKASQLAEGDEHRAPDTCGNYIATLTIKGE